MNLSWAMTTSKRRKNLSDFAKQLAAELEIPIIERANQGMDKLKAQYQLDYLLVEEENELAVYGDESRLVFHPGMALPRVKLFSQGKPETIIEAMALKTGDKVLDCTMGLAGDALLASYLVGEEGEVIAVESSPLIYGAVKYGLAHCTKGSKELQNAMRRIVPKWGDYYQLLPLVQEKCFDLVYFDPMFDRPLKKSTGIRELRAMANYAPISEEGIAWAKRAAKKRVVIKHRSGSMPHIAFDEVISGKYSHIAFGIFYQ